MLAVSESFWGYKNENTGRGVWEGSITVAWRMKSPFHLLSVVLDGDLEVDVNVGLLGDSDDVRELDGQPRGLVQVVDGKDFQTGTSDHDLGLVNLGALKVQHTTLQ